MAIWLDHRSKVIVQGMTGSEGTKHTRRMLASGTNIVGGVNARKAGTTVDFDGAAQPVFGSVAEAMDKTGADVSVLFVPPGSFNPPPKVDSAVVRMIPREQPADLDPKLLEELVQVAFSQRRKILRNTLGKWLEAKGFAGEFDLQRRAEEVPVAEFEALAAQLS